MSNFILSDFISFTAMTNCGGLLFVSRIVFDVVTYPEKMYSHTCGQRQLEKGKSPEWYDTRHPQIFYHKWCLEKIKSPGD